MHCVSSALQFQQQKIKLKKSEVSSVGGHTCAALTMPMSMPQREPQCRKALWKARRTASLPRKLNATLLTPPLILQPATIFLVNDSFAGRDGASAASVTPRGVLLVEAHSVMACRTTWTALCSFVFHSPFQTDTGQSIYIECVCAYLGRRA